MTLTRMWDVHSYGLTDIGLVRDRNEDAWARNLACHLYALADGIGGRQAGEVASQRAVHRLCEIFSENSKARRCAYPEAVCDLLWNSIQQVNREIYHLGQQNEFLKGMGTTLCALLVLDDIVYMGHLGDSRIYLLRNGQLSRLTQDHKPPSAVCQTYSHLISRALGVCEIAQPTVTWHPARAGDLFLMCTDGLSNALSDEQIEEVLLRDKNLKECCHTLIDQAKHAGGGDNITALLVHLNQLVNATQRSSGAESAKVDHGTHLLR